MKKAYYRNQFFSLKMYFSSYISVQNCNLYDLNLKLMISKLKILRIV